MSNSNSSSGNSIAIGAPNNTNNAGWYVTPSTTSIGIGSSGIFQQYPSTITVSGATNITYKCDKYYIMKLPEEVKKKMPESVYVNGMLASLGMFGSDVDVAFTGQDLLFQAGILNALRFGEKIKVAVYFKKKIYHFKCLPNAYGGVITDGVDSNVIDTELLSVVER